jgi:hypothetical protein
MATSRCRVVVIPRVGNRSTPHYLLLEVSDGMVNLRPGKESEVECQDLQSCSSHPCQLRTDMLASMSKY